VYYLLPDDTFLLTQKISLRLTFDHTNTERRQKKARKMVAAMMKGVAMMLMSSMMTSVESYSMISMKSSSSAIKNGDAFQNRRSFLSSAAAVGAAFGVSAVVQPEAALAGPQIVTTNTGIKYAVTKELQKGSKAIVPQKGDFVVVEYTGYLANGQVGRC